MLRIARRWSLVPLLTLYQCAECVTLGGLNEAAIAAEA